MKITKKQEHKNYSVVLIYILNINKAGGLLIWLISDNLSKYGIMFGNLLSLKFIYVFYLQILETLLCWDISKYMVYNIHIC